MTVDPPGGDVLAAFGLTAAGLRRLRGGRGISWRVGDTVLKRADDPAEAQFVAALFAALPASGSVRTARPVRTASGGWLASGWSAWSWLPGKTATGRWREVFAAGSALHALLADAPRPGCLDDRSDAWAIGDRVAWGETPLVVESAELRSAATQFAARLEACEDPPQLVHGDLTGNVLVEDGLPPAVIDMSCYWRPSRWALAVVAADAVAWHDARNDVAALIPGPRPLALLARAALYRLVTADRIAAKLGEQRTTYLADNAVAFERVVAVLHTSP